MPGLPLWAQRKGLLLSLAQCFKSLSGLLAWLRSSVHFHHILITDILTSATLLLWELLYAVCHFSTTDWSYRTVSGSDGALSPDACSASHSPFMQNFKTAVYCIPFWMRLVQCLALWHQSGYLTHRHVVNGGKYLSALAVIITSAALSWVGHDSYRLTYGVWITSLVIKTIYCTFWDLRIDWGLVQPGASGLRHVLVFASRWYYAASVFNLLGRVSWALAISPNFCNESCTLGLGIVELVRRSQWLVFRVGKPHASPSPIYARQI